MFTALQLSLHTALPEPIPRQVRAHVFLDAGSLASWRPDLSVGSNLAAFARPLEHLRACVGVGLSFWFMPGVRLEANLTRPLRVCPGDQTRHFQISLMIGGI